MNASLAPDNIQPTSPSGNTLLEVDQISLSFGGVKALQDVSFSVEEKQITAIIGPNGAGKTSMLNVINGFYHPQQGQICLLYTSPSPRDGLLSRMPSSA